MLNLIKDLLLLLDSTTLKGNAPPSTPKNPKSLPSTPTDSYIMTPAKREEDKTQSVSSKKKLGKKLAIQTEPLTAR